MIEKQIGKPQNNKNKLIAVIRIAGLVKIRKDIEETLNRMRLRRKYSCVLFRPTKDSLGMIKKVKDYIAYGEIDKKTLTNLLKSRAESINGGKRALEIDFEKAAEDLMNGKSLKDLKLKSFFRLHPPRKGIKSKLKYPKGVLGENKKINELINRML